VVLVALAVSDGVTREPVGRAALLQLAMDEIERSLADPDLTPDLIARRVSISVSNLTKLFAAHGTSVGRWLLHTRDDPRSVTEIAHACGFRNSAHFARAFRLRSDLTPSARRAHPRVAGSDRDQRR
jgi:AraC-like DNA-binding protein